jgi:hypothetical protein
MFRHVASLFKGLTGGVSQNLAFFHICEIPLVSALTLRENAAIFAHPGVQTQVRAVLDLKPLRVLRSGILQTQKSARFLRISGF